MYYAYWTQTERPGGTVRRPVPRSTFAPVSCVRLDIGYAQEVGDRRAQMHASRVRPPVVEHLRPRARGHGAGYGQPVVKREQLPRQRVDVRRRQQRRRLFAAAVLNAFDVFVHHDNGQ